MNNSLRHALMVAFAALTLIGGHFYMALPTCSLRNYCFAFDLYAFAPYRYRILHYILEGAPTYDSSRGVLIFSDWVIHSACVVLVCIGLFIWLRRWSTAETAVMGVFMLAVGWFFAFNYYQRDTATALELIFLVWMLVLIERRLLFTVILLIIASLNRETGLFLALIWGLYHLSEWRMRRYWLNLGLLLITYGLVTLALRVSLGGADHILGFQGTLDYNLSDLSGVVLINSILAPLWIVTALSYRKAPPNLQRLLWIMLLYVPSVVVGGGWFETPRLALPMYPLLLAVIFYTERSRATVGHAPLLGK